MMKHTRPGIVRGFVWKLGESFVDCWLQGQTPTSDSPPPRPASPSLPATGVLEMYGYALATYKVGQHVGITTYENMLAHPPFDKKEVRQEDKGEGGRRQMLESDLRFFWPSRLQFRSLYTRSVPANMQFKYLLN